MSKTLKLFSKTNTIRSQNLKSNHGLLKICHIKEWFFKEKDNISTESLSLLSENNHTVILLDYHGNPVTFCHSLRNSLIAIQYLMAQYDTFRDESKREYLKK